MEERQLTPVGLRVRAGAAVVDTVVFAGLFAGLLFFMRSRGATDPYADWLTVIVIGGYYLYMFGEFGQSIGNACFGSFLVGQDGKRPGYLGGAVRSLFFVAPLAALVAVRRMSPEGGWPVVAAAALFAAYTLLNTAYVLLPGRLTLYDKATGTAVVFPEETSQDAERRAGWKAVLVIVAGLLFLVVFASLALLIGAFMFPSGRHFC